MLTHKQQHPMTAKYTQIFNTEILTTYYQGF